MTSRIVRARLSALFAEVEFIHAAQAANAFDGIWSVSATREFTPCLRHLHIRAVRRDAGFIIEIDTEPPLRVAEEALVCPTIERQLYNHFIHAEDGANRAVLHASGLVRDDVTLVFAGESGAGKSAFARVAVERGWNYFSDEHLVTDGTKIWGVPRAIHLDLVLADAQALPWHVGADRVSYVFPGQDGRTRCLPFVPVAEPTLAQAAAPVKHIVLVALHRAERNHLASLTVAKRLELLERAHFLRAPALAEVALAPHAYSLTWREPDEAFALLMETMPA